MENRTAWPLERRARLPAHKLRCSVSSRLSRAHPYCLFAIQSAFAPCPQVQNSDKRLIRCSTIQSCSRLPRPCHPLRTSPPCDLRSSFLHQNCREASPLFLNVPNRLSMPQWRCSLCSTTTFQDAPAHTKSCLLHSDSEFQ